MEDLIIQLHWVYVLVMLGGALYFYLQSKKTTGVPKYEYLVAILIPVWSALAYFSIAIGQGYLETSEQTIYYARYLDWVITTPLLLLALALTAMFYTSKNITLILTLVFSDVIMILSGLIADFSNDYLKYIWYSIGMIALFIILYIIWIPLKNISKTNNNLYRHYKRTALYLTIFWFSYPTVWLIGPSGLGLLPEFTDVLAFILLPIFSKVGFSILDLYGLSKLKLTTSR